MNQAATNATKKRKIIALVQANRLAEAQTLCSKLCNVHARDPEAWLMLAGINAGLGAFGAVIEYCQRAIELAPRHAGAHYNLGVALTRCGRPREALDAYQAALRINPGHAAADAGAASALRDLGRDSEAEQHYRRALQQESSNPHLHNELASLLVKSDRLQEALEQVDNACRLQANLAAAHYNRGVILGRLRRLEAAVEAYIRALQLEPDHVAACNNLGHTLNELGQPDQALPWFRKVLTLSPDSAQGHNNIAISLETLGRLDEAEQHYRSAIALDSNMIDPRNHLGFMLAEQGRFDDALQVFDETLVSMPENPGAAAGKATTLEHMGQHQAAYEALEPALAGDSVDGDVARAFAIVARHLDKQDEAIAVCERALQSPGLPAKGVADLHFSLAQLHDRLQHWDAAFRHCELANRASRGVFNSDELHCRFSRIMQAFSPTAIRQLPRAAINSERPVFIVGMPRSGTSLVEQIVASHPDVHGAGELTGISEIETILAAESASPWPACISKVDQHQLERMATRYLQQLAQHSRDARLVTDKMPHNFMSLGLINLLFPHARVIHVRRDPMDTCVSLYFQNFNAMHAYTTDLSALGRYYCEYQRLMTHWRSALDMSFMEIDYEDLVSDQERVSREIIDFCGLPWNEQCLEFHASSRFAKTPSYDQVRQPLYSRSVGRWQHYRQHLSALQQALECDRPHERHQ